MKPKKKGYAKQTATFLKIEDAVFWEEHVKKNLNAMDTDDYCPLNDTDHQKCKENQKIEIHHHPHYQSLNDKLMNDFSNLSFDDYHPITNIQI